MKPIRTALLKLAIAVAAVLLLIYAENTYVHDAIFRGQLVLITSGCGLLAGTLLSIQVASEIIKLRLHHGTLVKLNAVRNAAIVAIITGYLAIVAVNAAMHIRRQSDAPKLIDVIELVVFACIVIFGVAVLVRMIANSRPKN